MATAIPTAASRQGATDSLAERYEALAVAFGVLEHELGEHRKALGTGAWRPGPAELEGLLRRLADGVAAARLAADALQQGQRAERRQLGHDIRAALGAIAGWAHVLRLEQNAGEKVARVADVLDRNVRALAKVAEHLHS
jgi:hypothetical protein